jgi:hypothetical protein
MIRSLSDSAATNLNTRLASQATLEVHQSTANLVAHGGLAVLRASDRVLAAGGGCAVSASATNTGALGG